MSNREIIRSWKDKSYRRSLSADEMAKLPPNPAGRVELTDQELEAAVGGAPQSQNCSSWGFCWTKSFICELLRIQK